MPRKERIRYHYIYKITCVITNKYYIGMHSTYNLEDGYLGSGTRIGYSIKKYGKANHIKEILEFFPDRESLADRESFIINEDLLDDELCLNLRLGGEFSGGFVDNDHMVKFCKAGNIAFKEKLRTDEIFAKEFSDKCKESAIKYKKGWVGNPLNWKGKKHKAESIELMKTSSKGVGIGENNSQFNTCWITNGIISKKINKSEELPIGWRFGRKISSVSHNNPT